jgi:ABC-type polysaccharide/polyol phosphate transport system ATPase subunit
MPESLIAFENVWKKFRRGEHHDSLRDLIPALAKRLTGRRREPVLDADEFWVLRNLSFEVRPGQALGIIGPNGAGKSTALKLLTRILKPTRGVARLHGRVGALIELAAGFHPDLTGRENIFLQGAIMGMKREEIRRRFDEIVDFAGIPDFIDTPVKRYSSGMNARLGFAIAAHVDPEVLLIDEVLAVGDFTFQQKCYERLERFRHEGIPIAFVSHNMQAIASLCDRVLLLRPGQEPIVGPVPDVLADYASSKGTLADPRLKVLNATLTHPGTGAEVTAPVPPGTSMVLDVELAATERLIRCGVLIQLVRSDGLVIFTGMSTLDGLAEVDLEPSDRLKARIAFQANTLRGTYILNLQLVDGLRQWPTAFINGLRSFVVTETSRIAGCAEILPSYDLTVTRASATGDPLAAAHRG